MNRITAILFFASCMVACKASRYVPVEKVTETKIEVVEIIRDTTVYVPADRATLQALLECDSAGKVLVRQVETLQGKLQAKAGIYIRDSVIIIDCICDSTAIYLQLKDRYETKSTASIEIQTRFIEKKLKRWQKSMIGIGCLASLITVIGVTVFICRKR